MKSKILLFSILFIASSTLFAQWEYVGSDTGITDFDVWYIDLEFQPNSNDPHIFYQYYDINNGAYFSMKKFNGVSWEYVGEEVIDELMVANDHLSLAFDPINANVPIAYYHNGQLTTPPVVIKLSGNSWEQLPGLSNFMIQGNSDVQNDPVSTPRNYDFDVSPTGNPVLGFQDNNCTAGGFENPPGNMSVVTHDGAEWQFLGNSCLSPRAAGNIDLQYNPVTDELFGYHKGGNELTEFDQIRQLVKLNGTQWDSITSPAIPTSFIVGLMEINPVSGHPFIFDWGYSDGIGSERQFKMYEWDGTDLISHFENDDLDIMHANWLTAFHPITGEIHILYRQQDFENGPHLNIKKYNGSGWVDTPFSDIQDLPNTAMDYKDMAFHPNGDLYIVRREGLAGEAVVIKRDGEPAIGISEASNTSSKLQVYPNPTTGNLRFIDFSSHQSENYNVAIYNTLGTIVMNRQMNAEQIREGVDVTTLSSGYYSIQLSNSQRTYQSQFVVE